MERIGRNQYYELLSSSELTEEQRKQLEGYESEKNIKGNTEAEKSYLEKLKTVDAPKVIKKSKEQLWVEFKDAFFMCTGGDEFIINQETKMNIACIMRYFLCEKEFFESPNLMRMSEPSFKKGLLIMGGYGSGKSKVMEALQMVFVNDPNLRFKRYDANEVVDMYEAIKSPVEKDSFWEKMVSGVAHFDDVKTERIASNYGKTNVFKDILEKRNTKSLRTFITCNYREGRNGDIDDGLKEFYEKYGARVYDRLFMDFNIIQWNGKSFRK